MIFTLADKNVYYAGKVVGRVDEIRTEKDGIRAILTITDAKTKRYLQGGAANFSVTV